MAHNHLNKNAPSSKGDPKAYASNNSSGYTGHPMDPYNLNQLRNNNMPSHSTYPVYSNPNETLPNWSTNHNTRLKNDINTPSQYMSQDHKYTNPVIHDPSAFSHIHSTVPPVFSNDPQPFITSAIREPYRGTEPYLNGPIGQPFSDAPLDNSTLPDDSLSDPTLNEPPLLEELGIYPEHILKRMQSALLLYKIDQNLLLDVDMCGPLFIAACLGCCLLLAGKVQFGSIYALSVTGCLGLFVLLNLMSQNHAVDVYKTISILGYGLLPIVILAAISIFMGLRNLTGTILSTFTVLWCTATASRFFEIALEMKHQRFLVAYPILLLYGSFILITVF